MLNTVNTFNHGKTLHMLIGELLLISRQKQEYQAPITNDEKNQTLCLKIMGRYVEDFKYGGNGGLVKEVNSFFFSMSVLIFIKIRF